MNEPQAFLNGRVIAATALSIPVYDAGFVQGTTVAEQLRTFGGELFRLEEHLQRLTHSLEQVGIDPGYSTEQLASAATALVAHNHALLPEEQDLGLVILVTPGVYLPLAPAGTSVDSQVAMHTYRLPFEQWADKFDQGQRLRTVSVRQVPETCWPRELKCRSRMHYYLADREAHELEPGSRAILQDLDGFVVESSTANVLGYRASGGLISPPREKILPGISMAALLELASALDVPVEYRDISPSELGQCDEVLLTSTSICVLPVVAIDGQRIGDGTPGTFFRRLLAAWSQQVGVDIAAQAQQSA